MCNVCPCWQGGHADLSTVAKMVLNDWQRGKIPFFVRPPDSEVRRRPLLPVAAATVFFVRKSMWHNS